MEMDVYDVVENNLDQAPSVHCVFSEGGVEIQRAIKGLQVKLIEKKDVRVKPDVTALRAELNSSYEATLPKPDELVFSIPERPIGIGRPYAAFYGYRIDAKTGEELRFTLAEKHGQEAVVATSAKAESLIKLIADFCK